MGAEFWDLGSHWWLMALATACLIFLLPLIRQCLLRMGDTNQTSGHKLKLGGNCYPASWRLRAIPVKQAGFALAIDQSPPQWELGCSVKVLAQFLPAGWIPSLGQDHCRSIRTRPAPTLGWSFGSTRPDWISNEEDLRIETTSKSR